MAMQILRTRNKIITKKLRSLAKTIPKDSARSERTGKSETAEELYLPLWRSQSQRALAKMKFLVTFELNITHQSF